MSTSIDLDQHTRPHWTDTERANVELVAEFVRLIMNEHDYTTARERFGDHPYVQHSRGIPDGIDNLFVYLEGITKRFPGYSYEVKRVTVDDDQVTNRSASTCDSSRCYAAGRPAITTDCSDRRRRMGRMAQPAVYHSAAVARCRQELHGRDEHADHHHRPANSLSLPAV